MHIIVMLQNDEPTSQLDLLALDRDKIRATRGREEVGDLGSITFVVLHDVVALNRIASRASTAAARIPALRFTLGRHTHPDRPPCRVAHLLATLSGASVSFEKR